VPSRSCWSAIQAQARVILPPAWRSPPVVNASEYASPPPLRWSPARRGATGTEPEPDAGPLVPCGADRHRRTRLCPLAEVAAELLFQVIAERAEKAAIIVTTNLPFSEWPRSLPMPGSARQCLIDSPIRHTS